MVERPLVPILSFPTIPLYPSSSLPLLSPLHLLPFSPPFTPPSLLYSLPFRSFSPPILSPPPFNPLHLLLFSSTSPLLLSSPSRLLLSHAPFTPSPLPSPLLSSFPSPLHLLPFSPPSPLLLSTHS